MSAMGPRLCENSYIGEMQKTQFSDMASKRMCAALSVLMTRNFSKMFLRARRALEFSHGLGQSRRFRDVCDMSALPPTTAVMMQCGERQKGANCGLPSHCAISDMSIGAAMQPTTCMVGQQSPRSRGKEFHMDKRATLLGRPFSHRDIAWCSQGHLLGFCSAASVEVTRALHSDLGNSRRCEFVRRLQVMSAFGQTGH